VLQWAEELREDEQAEEEGEEKEDIKATLAVCEKLIAHLEQEGEESSSGGDESERGE
jgi:hypothetical protein